MASADVPTSEWQALPEPLDRIYPNGVEYTVEEHNPATDTYRCQVVTARGDTQLLELPGDLVRRRIEEGDRD